MTSKEYQRLEEDLRQLTLVQLKEFLDILTETTDEQFSSLIDRRIAADYVMREVRGRLNREVSELHKWIREASNSYSERMKNVHRPAAIRTESGTTEELIADEV